MITTMFDRLRTIIADAIREPMHARPVPRPMGEQIRDALRREGKPVLMRIDPVTNGLRYDIDGQLFSPIQAATRLGLTWQDPTRY